MKCDVAIIGGGPAGATVGTLLKKFNPDLDVVILEREKFPRDHVGESLLPAVTGVLDEMGVWDAVEAANFPIKLGATYRWGKHTDDDLYYFHFLPEGKFTQTERPGKYTGQRRQTTFQVDRSVYDKLLLDHAKSMGCRVYEQSRVTQVLSEGDRIEGLQTYLHGSDEIETITATTYVDASGGESIVRKTMGVEVESPTLLRNIAIWDYWHNTEWAEKIGVGGTYVYVLSINYGWIWFIPSRPNSDLDWLHHFRRVLPKVWEDHRGTVHRGDRDSASGAFPHPERNTGEPTRGDQGLELCGGPPVR